MMDLPELQKHPAREVFYKKGVARCAQYLNVSTAYLRDIMNGVHRASGNLSEQIDTLYSALQQQEVR